MECIVHVRALETERAGRQRRPQKGVEQAEREQDDDDAINTRAKNIAALDKHQQAKHHQHHGQDEAKPSVKQNCDTGDHDDRGRVPQISPIDIGKRRALSRGAQKKQQPELQSVQELLEDQQHGCETSSPEMSPPRGAGPQRQGYGRNPLMHDPGKSDPPIVPGKRPNKPGQPGAEAVEGRGGAKGTAGRQSTGRTQSRETVSQALACVREAAKRNRKERFTALMPHVTPELLAWAFHQLKARAAPGVDGVTWEEYAGALDGNIGDLHRRVMRGGYRAKPSRRQYIPKADGRQRPLSIAALKDKIVQRALVEVLNAIYETDFLGLNPPDVIGTPER